MLSAIGYVIDIHCVTECTSAMKYPQNLGKHEGLQHAPLWPHGTCSYNHAFASEALRSAGQDGH